MVTTKLNKRRTTNKKGLKLRVNANRLNRQLGTYGNGDGKDAAHYKGSTTKADSKVHQKPKSRLKIRK